MKSQQQKVQLRKELRERRRQLSPTQQRAATKAFLKHLFRQPALQMANTIACYWANDGELNVLPVVAWGEKRRKSCFLPALNRQKLIFLPYRTNTDLCRNRFGIPEPATNFRAAIPPWRLDVVLLPLVGFDCHGGRLGMGGGYYDATFTRLQQRPRQPVLIGVGHRCQRVERVPREAWDVPLDAVMSDSGLVYVAKHRRNLFRLPGLPS